MEVDRTTASESVEHERVTYHFCSAACRSAFQRDPGRYAVEPTNADPATYVAVDPATSEYRSDHRGETYYFCSSRCKARFDSEPDKYVDTPKDAA